MEIIDSFILNVFPYIYYGLWFIIILSIIVAIHEFGHYLVAKISGVKIEAFSIGFGKELIGWNDRSGTRWKLCLLPLGGYVKMFGDIDPASTPDAKKISSFTEEERKIAFHTKPLYIKALVVMAGPLANFILGILILTGLYFGSGIPVSTSKIGGVVEGSPAFSSGIKKGDVVTSIDGVKIETFDQLQQAIGLNTGDPIDIKLDREGKTIELKVKLEMKDRKDIFGGVSKLPTLGVFPDAVVTKETNLLGAFYTANYETYRICKVTLQAVGQMIVGSRSTESLRGPIGIAEYSAGAVDMGGAVIAIYMAIISINLGLFNLFPIPLLDGGHLLYYTIEAVRGKKMADKAEKFGFRVGVAILLLLFVVATFNDLKRLIGF